MWAKTSAGSVFTSSFLRTTGTGTTIAKACSGPLYVFDIVSAVRLPLRTIATCEALLVSFSFEPATKKPQNARAGEGSARAASAAVSMSRRPGRMSLLGVSRTRTLSRRSTRH